MSIQRLVTLVGGIIFILIGILGFFPVFTPGGALLGLFAVNAVHNIVHLLLGIIALIAVYLGMSQLYNKVIGIVYLLLAIIGFILLPVGPGLLLGIVAINLADNFLHLVLGIVLAGVGFLVPADVQTARA
ncbi:MAG: DUF4383 domain-containing protein [Chloroflexi bacterium]|nr:DUF4383 domain-containing protein [Ktedonobacteraceae bacterium]MBV8821156.1 DUF4383 domain-containing protein [Ktedonobacteraceae bacterium]MBV9021289.1 DUF4383 domain-containing protein [Ktedonobacteraceae bacterium]MBV9707653.1 DUF4383 domain-containing protein [Chloroflexota bacterium]